MKSFTKKAISVLLFAALTAGLAACGGTEQPAADTSAPAESQDTASAPADTATANEASAAGAEPATITFALWDEVQSPVFQEVVDKFQEQNPNIKVELQLTPWSQYWTKLDAAAGAGNAADVLWMNVFLPKYVDGGVLMPIDDLVARDGLDLSQWNSTITDMYTYNGQLYGLPKGHDVVDVYFNKAIFDKYGVAYPQNGWTWADMVDLGTQLRDAIKSQGGSEYPLVMELDEQPSYYNFIWQEGGYIINSDGTDSGFNKPETVKALQDVVDLMGNEIMPSYNVLSDTKGTDIFLAQKAAMVFAGSWKASLMDEASFASDIGIIQMPKKSANADSVLGGLCFVINAGTESPDAAWEFVKFLAGAESNEMQAAAKIDMPAYFAAQSTYTKNFNNIDGEVIVESAKESYPFPTHTYLSDIMPIVNDTVQEIFAGKVSAQDGCDRIYSQLQDEVFSR